MKKVLIVAALGLFTVGALAQGTVNFLNRVPGVLDAKVLRADGTTPAGAGFWAQLWAGPVGGALAAVDAPVQFLNLGTGAPSGYFNGGTRTIPGIPAGGPATVQIRAWDGKNGTITSYDQAVAALVEVGSSTPLNLASTGNPAASPPVPPVNLVGLQGFQLAVVPEPTTYALLGLGAAVLLFRRRK